MGEWNLSENRNEPENFVHRIGNQSLDAKYSVKIETQQSPDHKHSVKIVNENASARNEWDMAISQDRNTNIISETKSPEKINDSIFKKFDSKKKNVIGINSFKFS